MRKYVLKDTVRAFIYGACPAAASSVIKEIERYWNMGTRFKRFPLVNSVLKSDDDSEMLRFMSDVFVSDAAFDEVEFDEQKGKVVERY